jgi:hypothetical protein
MSPAALEAYVDAASAAIDLKLDASHRPGVLRYIALAAEMAAQVDAVDLAPHDEAAVHFSPIVPGSGNAA